MNEAPGYECFLVNLNKILARRLNKWKLGSENDAFNATALLNANTLSKS